MDDSTYLDISKGLNIYYSMFLIIIGTVFNALCIIILSRKTFRGTTFSIYFRYLAVVDLFTLYSGLTRHFIYGAFEYKTRESSEMFCKLHYWTTTTSPDISAWILVAVTTERVLSIIKPLAVHDLFSRRNVCLLLFFISISLLLINIPTMVSHGDLVVSGPNNTVTVEKCTINRSEMKYFMENIWWWIDLTKFVILPSSILSILNTVIIISVVKSRKRVEKFISAPSTRSNYEKATRSLVPQKELSLTITLLVVNITYILLNSPISIYLLGEQYWFEDGFTPKERLVYTCGIMAMYTNNAANFLLYCATGTKFRSEIRHLFKGCYASCYVRNHEIYSPNAQSRDRLDVNTVSSSIHDLPNETPGRFGTGTGNQTEKHNSVF